LDGSRSMVQTCGASALITTLRLFVIAPNVQLRPGAG
jgi:hypothetical protein